MVHPQLPVLQGREPPTGRAPQRGRAVALAAIRAVLFVGIIWSIHRLHQQRTEQALQQPAAAPPLDLAQSLFPEATSLELEADGRATVRDAQGEILGSLLQTSPQSDRIIGFSGPTNVLIALNTEDRILGLRILSSRDTQEHVDRVVANPRFLASYTGLTRREATSGPPVDGVSGATLTSLAIAESIAHRLGGIDRSLRFPEPLSIEQVLTVFPDADAIVQDSDLAGLWHVSDEAGNTLGAVLRTSPAADNLVGYQGPTESLVLLKLSPRSGANGDHLDEPGPNPIADWTVSQLSLGRSYDNEPYVDYVREDRYFHQLFTGLTLRQLAGMDLRAAGVEGVSGATMTSLAVAEGLVITARQFLEEEQQLRQTRDAQRLQLSARDIGTISITLLGTAIGLSSLRRRRWFRLAFLVVLVLYLGFVNGDLVSQALLVGWARNGVPWQTMLGPLVLTAAAVTLPLLAGSNVYCAHLCPHGALQQLVKSRLPVRLKLSRGWRRVLSFVPGLLLLLVLHVALSGSVLSLVDIEPFDAYVPTIAGWPTLTLFAVGLGVSLFVPMAYCQYGCPTGALLNWLRRQHRADAWGPGDLLALGGLLVGLILIWS